MKKLIYVLAAIVIAALLLYYIASSFSPGSYANAKTYELKIAEGDLIKLIERFKEENPALNVPKEVLLEDHRNNYWYVIYFYYPDKDEIVYTWTRSSGANNSILALVGVNEGLVLGNWKRINEELDHGESAAQIQMFEERVLRHLEKSIQDLGN